MSLPLIDPLSMDDTELGAAVRDAYARGARVIALIPVVCPCCGRPVKDCTPADTNATLRAVEVPDAAG